jgi:hypothetical protein
VDDDNGYAEVSFGALPPLPAGYRVLGKEGELYFAEGPKGWQGAESWDRFRVRRTALYHAKLQERQP